MSAIQDDLEKFTTIKLLHSKNKLTVNEQLVQYTQYQHYLSTESVPYKLLLSMLIEEDDDLAAFVTGTISVARPVFVKQKAG